MTTKRLAILLAVLLAGMSTVFVLPKATGVQPVGLNLRLPQSLGQWWGEPLEVTEREREVLGERSGTEFARMRYTSGRGDRVVVSIILSGEDMMTSIHRPERCLLAQGWNPGGSQARKVPVERYGSMGLTRLRNSRLLQYQGQTIPLENVCYYYFVGHTHIAATHEERVWQDAWDRLIHGYNQRWAMVMVSAEITDKLERFGRNEADTDKLLEKFIEELTPQLLTETVKS